MTQILDLSDVLVSMWRWSAGLICGSLLGFLLAVLCFWVRPLREGALLVAGFFRALPILALVPLFIILFGVGEIAKILLITWACFFPVFVSTTRSVGRRLPDIELKIQALRKSEWDVFRHYHLPRLLFGFLSGVEIAIGIGWLTVVAAEMTGTPNFGIFRGGLGNAVQVAFDNGNIAVGLMCLAVFGILGLTTALIWARLSSAFVRAAGFDRGALVE